MSSILSGCCAVLIKRFGRNSNYQDRVEYFTGMELCWFGDGRGMMGVYTLIIRKLQLLSGGSCYNHGHHGPFSAYHVAPVLGGDLLLERVGLI